MPVLLLCLGYQALYGVQSGMDAQVAYAEAVDPVASKCRTNLLRWQLLAYYALNTLALVKIWRKFRG